MALSANELNLPVELARLREILERHSVAEASVFGSYARGSAGPGSDLDLLVEFSPEADPWEFLALQEELNSILSGGADVVTRLNKHFAQYVEPDLVRIV
ncbi:nucleotidyltransferase family protein [Rhodococcoides kyotonense]|uniref:Polymerase nucleotidyl transferase domain-containing protein n=1 Tax=Rhodococcoides kyotonense TaxID=398843 RepID=A0A239KE13_9NOCA|nr:nucleotidyltransferase domain-containing protein [Rhodococcus kyotonensis]SNT15889.1 hypothetical protein SAMN05421642_11084 [Rhodococcus kyotonensis]